MHQQNTKPEYWRVRISADGEPDTEELLLVLGLPDDFEGPVECTVRCASPAEYAAVLRLHGSNALSIKGYQSNVGGEQVATLDIDSARILRSGVASHGAEHKEWESSIHADNTTIRRPLNDSSADECHSLLFVTENHWLAPPPFEMPNDDGSLDAPDIYPDLRVQFGLQMLDTMAEFVRTYDWRSSGDELTRTRHFAAKIPNVDVGESDEIRDQVYKEVDDFLLLAGLATATYSQCVGFAAIGGDTSTISYRRDHVVDRDINRQSNANETIVNPGEFDKFWAPTYRNFCASDFKDEIRTCLHTLRASKGVYLEPSFLMKFAVLELLLSRHRDLRGLSRILDESSWRSLKKTLSNAISGQAAIDKALRKSLHGNLSQMNRLPLRAAFDDLVAQYKVDLEGIWPLFGVSNSGLDTVRNLMVHGATMTKDVRFLPALSFADTHLLWTLEIILLALLQWPRSSTNRREKALGALFGDVANPARIAELQNDISELAGNAH